MSLPDTSVKFFTSDMAGAPALSGTAGTLIGVLDACLIDGFGSVTLDSLSVTDNVATATVSAGHGFAMLGNTGPVIEISGATPAELNSVWRVASVPNSTTFTFAVEGIANGTASGTITAKRAPAGWEKRYSDTNKAVYARTDITATASLLRVDDTSTVSAPVKAYLSMTDVDTGAGAWPSANRWAIKSSSANATPVDWVLLADELLFYLVVKTASTVFDETVFGDFIPYRTPDVNACWLSAADGSTYAKNNFHVFNATTGSDLAGSYTQLSGSVGSARYSHGRSTAMGGNVQIYPSPADNGFHGWPVEIWEETTIARGLAPGLYNPIHTGMIPNLIVISDVPGLEEHDLVVLNVRSTSNAAAFDLTGPWRD